MKIFFFKCALIDIIVALVLARRTDFFSLHVEDSFVPRLF